VEGLKSFPRALTSASGVRAGQSFWTIEYRSHANARCNLASGRIPLQSASGLACGASGLVCNINSASGVRTIDKRFAGGYAKSKVIIADLLWEGLAYFRGRGGYNIPKRLARLGKVLPFTQHYVTGESVLFARDTLAFFCAYFQG
jgi:hypothetical protein